MALLKGVDQIKTPGDSTLIFEHPAVTQGPLYVRSGATAIKWAYNLNTKSTPTIGGEVVQILSAFVGPIQITGQTAGLSTNRSSRLAQNQIKGWQKINGKDNYSPFDELRSIILWFEEYMEKAGATTRDTTKRNELAVKFTYATRGWVFYIMPTSISGFRYDNQTIAPEWSLAAEVVNDNALDFFSGVTMSSFNDDLITNQDLLGQIGISAFAKSKTETANPAFGQTGSFGSTDIFLNPQLGPSAVALATKMGDNFQALVAAFSNSPQAGFQDFGFGALLDNGVLPKNVDQVYSSLFGNTFLGQIQLQGTAQGGGGSGTQTYGTTSNNPKDTVAVLIANAFSAAGMPPELGLAIALHESGLNPDARSANDGGPGIDGVGLFQAHNPGGADGSQACRLASSVDRSSPPTKNYPMATQIANAVKWIGAAKPSGFPSTNLTTDQLAQWAFTAQRGVNYTNGDSTTGSCTTTFASQIAQAQSMISSFTASATSNATGLRASVLGWASKMLAYAQQTGKPPYSESARRDMEDITPGDFSALNAGCDCSSTIALLYAWGTNNNHKYGLNGNSFNGVTTVTMWATWAAQEIPKEQAKAGDLVIYGTSPSTSVHVNMFMEDWNGDNTTLFQHGTSFPHTDTWAGELSYFSSNGHPAHVFRVLP